MASETERNDDQTGCPRVRTEQEKSGEKGRPAPRPATDDLSLEELEGMVIAAPTPNPAAKSKADADADNRPATDETPKPPATEPAPPTEPSVARPAIARTPPGAKEISTNGVSPERAALLRDAMATHRSKSDVFDDLSEEAREKLYVMAMKTLVDKDFGEK